MYRYMYKWTSAKVCYKMEKIQFTVYTGKINNIYAQKSIIPTVQ